MDTDALVPAFLLAVLRCPACRRQRWTVAESGSAVNCGACGVSHRVSNGILQLTTADVHPEVAQERASVPATELAPDLGGWKESYTPATDPASSLALAYLSLPYGNDSAHFQEPGYFQNVRRFSAEFDFIRRHLPDHGLLLDIGADGTWSTARLAQHGLTCIALDITDHLGLAHLFQTACPRYGLLNVDMHAPVFVDEAFDVVTAFNALHHSQRLYALAANIARVLKPGGVCGFVEPYVQNRQQQAAFGGPQRCVGINENIHTIERWDEAFFKAGLSLEAFALTDSFNAIYRKAERAATRRLVLDDFYHAAVSATPETAETDRATAVLFEVTVASRGRAAWATRGPEPTVRLSYHVSRITAGATQMVAFDNDRTMLPEFVAPGAPQRLTVPLLLTEPGDYLVEFDLVHETICWFGDRGGQTATARVSVW
jgi:SAM-dependent methyltransferase